jgi:hypothetical protein
MLVLKDSKPLHRLRLFFVAPRRTQSGLDQRCPAILGLCGLYSGQYPLARCWKQASGPVTTELQIMFLRLIQNTVHPGSGLPFLEPEVPDHQPPCSLTMPWFNAPVPKLCLLVRTKASDDLHPHPGYIHRRAIGPLCWRDHLRQSPLDIRRTERETSDAHTAQ